MKKRFLGLLTLVCSLAVLTGCGSTEDAERKNDGIKSEQETTVESTTEDVAEDPVETLPEYVEIALEIARRVDNGEDVRAIAEEYGITNKDGNVPVGRDIEFITSLSNEQPGFVLKEDGLSYDTEAESEKWIQELVADYEADKARYAEQGIAIEEKVFPTERYEVRIPYEWVDGDYVGYKTMHFLFIKYADSEDWVIEYYN
jgi:hypothetical protein